MEILDEIRKNLAHKTWEYRVGEFLKISQVLQIEDEIEKSRQDIFDIGGQILDQADDQFIAFARKIIRSHIHNLKE